jgi:hypothetical protein
MRCRRHLSAWTAGIIAAVMGAAYASGDEPSSRPPQTVPEAAGSGSSSLSRQLDRSGGVIRPPAGVDPAIAQPPPALGGNGMPIVPPPGTPGGKPGVTPK